MKRIALLFLFSMMLVVPLQAQYSPCYSSRFAEGKVLFNKGKYDLARARFVSAKRCPDPNTTEANKWIAKCDEQLELIKASEAFFDSIRLAQERVDSIQRLHELEIESKGYMHIKGVSFVNANYKGVPISQAGSALYDEELRFILPILSYEGLDEKDDTIALYVKFYNQDKELLRDTDSPSEYSYYNLSVIKPGNGNSLPLKLWGDGTPNYYSPGEYVFELWYSDKQLYNSSFVVQKKAPKEIVVDIKVEADADIYIDDEKKGTQSWQGLLSPGVYEIVCKKEGHRDTRKTITITENSEEQRIDLEPPMPIYGTVTIQSKPTAQVSIDGVKRGETPHSEKLLVGSYQVMLEKKGYNNYVETITVSEGRQIVDLKLTRQPNYNLFGSFFLDFVAGNFNDDDLLLGGHMSICPSSVGVYGLYLHGLNYRSSLGAGGLVIRLTEDVVDLQLLVGGGYGRVNSSSNVHAQTLLFDIGGRLGWKSQIGWAMWDLMGGCIISIDGDVYPYVGVGTGFSLIGAIGFMTHMMSK